MQVPSLSWLQDRLRQLRGMNATQDAAIASLEALLDMFHCQINDVDDFGAVSQLSRALIQTEAQTHLVTALKADPACAALIEERYLPPRHDLNALLNYPKDSLGYLYANSLQNPELYADLYSDIWVNSDASYIEARLSQTHDLWHVVTGFSTSVEDELGLQAFLLAQFPYPFAAMLIANSLVSDTLMEPHNLPRLLKAIEKGWQLGKQAKPLFAQKWELAWEKPLEQWRAELNLPVQKRPTPVLTHFKVRRATEADISFLAQIHYEACLPPLSHCVWDDILQGTGTETLPFLEALYQTNACAWGSVADAWVLEEHGKPVAGAMGYVPTEEDYRILNLSRLPALATALGWTRTTAELFRQQYEAVWGQDLQEIALQPQASWIVEFVAVIPEARGRGLVKPLLEAVLKAGRQQGHEHAGIMVIQGNDRAQRVYESLGFQPYITFDPHYFEDQFPGLTRFRLKL